MERTIVTVLIIYVIYELDSGIEFSEYKRGNKASDKYRKWSVQLLYKSTWYKAL